jgi:predicted AAA+ superfamily ATPase
MIPRLLQLPKKRSFFLFGARNIGKSTLIEQVFSGESSIIFDLLDDEQVSRLTTQSNEFYNIVTALPKHKTHIIIDEIQRAPNLLNDVQRLMKDKSKYFIMTGSSARKLKHGSANLLAGRAFVYHLYPFSYLELGDKFDLLHALQWGTLPEVFECETDQEKQQFLMSYGHTYLKEEIWNEHFIRQIDPFRRFLEVAAQCNGTIINYLNIARDVKVDDKTVKSYFSILEDTLIGFFLEPYNGSIRKRQSEKPKFYFFDTGITRALARELSIPLQPRTIAYGNAFEHYIITECIRLAAYFKPEYQFSYLKTPSNLEIDLIIDRPNKKTLLIEIKSSNEITKEKLSNFSKLSKDFKNSASICLSNEKYIKQINDIIVYPWKEGLKEIFLT